MSKSNCLLADILLLKQFTIFPQIINKGYNYSIYVLQKEAIIQERQLFEVNFCIILGAIILKYYLKSRVII